MEMSPFPRFAAMRRNKNVPGHVSSAAVNLENLLSLSLIPLSAIGLLVALIVVFLSRTYASPGCETTDQPNILHDLFPNNATGNFNATIAIVPISLDFARKVIPSSYTILEHAYRTLLPDFPTHMYPLIIQAGHDHNIRFMEYSIPDFSRVGFEFPFLDLLGDGFSSFRWAPEQMITASNKDALSGSRAYGTKVHPATFQPECNAYAHQEDGTYFNAESELARVSLSYRRYTPPSGTKDNYSLNFFKNVTNQPIFIDGSSCCEQIRLYNTRLSLGEYAPVRIKARVEARLGPFETPMSFEDIDGLQVLTPFIENNYVSCETLKGGKVTPQQLLEGGSHD